jgi:hypothetical protein
MLAGTIRGTNPQRMVEIHEHKTPDQATIQEFRLFILLGERWHRDMDAARKTREAAQGWVDEFSS